MKKKVKDFLKYLEKETSISIHLWTISPTLKTVNSLSYPINVNVVGINEGTLGLAVISCGCRNCKNLTGVEVLYGQNGSKLSDAVVVQSQIKMAIPSMQVEIKLMVEHDLQ